MTPRLDRYGDPLEDAPRHPRHLTRDQWIAELRRIIRHAKARRERGL